MGVDRPILCSSFIILMIFSYRPVSVKGQILATNFYSVACPLAESIVVTTMKYSFILQPSIAPAMLQLHYIDCFIQGCDASVLISGPNTEKTVVANLSRLAFQVIDDIKRRIELLCPGVVSCADILAIAAREAVVLVSTIFYNSKIYIYTIHLEMENVYASTIHFIMRIISVQRWNSVCFFWANLKYDRSNELRHQKKL